LFQSITVNLFNISKINSEVRGGKSPRIKRLSEYIGESYFDYLSGLPDLVLLMDESHRYRASAGVRAINELKPILGLELTATPFVETSRGTVPFKNVIYDYPLGRAMADGFVKESAVVTRKDFNPSGMSHEEIERMKLEDGVRLHESVKVELETYARESDNVIVKPFLLVIARDTTHAGQLLQLIRSDEFFEGRYRDKVIQVDSSKTGKEEDEMIERLLKVEAASEPTEIVIHVNMLIARFIHSQMQCYYWEEAVGYEVRISKGFTALKPSAYTYALAEPPVDFRVSPPDKSNMAKYLFGGFERCLYTVQKFDSEAERKLSVILDRETIKWFKPAKGQFQIFYRNGADYLEYQPDFVAETIGTIFMLESKAVNQMADSIVLAKKATAVKWCANASTHAQSYGGKPWRYLWSHMTKLQQTSLWTLWLLDSARWKRLRAPSAMNTLTDEQEMVFSCFV
jgi:hypothetical protein